MGNMAFAQRTSSLLAGRGLIRILRLPRQVIKAQRKKEHRIFSDDDGNRRSSGVWRALWKLHGENCPYEGPRCVMLGCRVFVPEQVLDLFFEITRFVFIGPIEACTDAF
jgi:hypothetical protein